MKIIFQWFHKVFDETVTAISDMLYITFGNNIEIAYNITGDDKDIYIILGAHRFDIPRSNKVIIVQTEQLDSKWFTSNYIRKLKDSMFVWDFSPRNVIELKKRYNLPIFYLPMRIPLSVFLNDPWTIQEDIDVLFFGAFHKRRKLFEDHIRMSLKCKKIIFRYNDLFGDEREDLIKRSKIVLNIHYWKNSSLATHRIENLCSKGKCIISEKSSDNLLDNEYKDSIEFVDIDDVVSMVLKIKLLLNNSSKRKCLSNNARINSMKRQLNF